ncbi:uncharacterized protein K460DRAFT_284693 [Cucurbitaria berberidis CBS 394.84]|uniref:Cyclin-like f-box protein n=1 Tax=Cucurbitaria berberidis CBS 394.84 TaxID=1168544 RepID=A0A9P4GJ22_9PLEO|nr:uncharacterized protein K460DRAFT_284693 [Cucurbitaria berberidis CBS 394.84]KAF1846129.1 hypothetical protein K460DRAFT_284693 [Cucurbitaria berberidis CBS 394.84]
MQKFLTFSALLVLTAALPQRNRGGGRTQQTAQQKAAQVPQGISQAQDGSMILDDTVTVNGLPLRFKISAPAAQFLPASGVPGAAATSSDGTLGVNVLLHGDGGQSFFDMPNQNVQANTMGVALLAPNAKLFWGGGQGLQRTDGVAHSQAVNDFIQNELPQRVAMNKSNVVFTGVSGGSLMLSGFFIPAQMQNYPNSAVELNCGGMPPQVDFQNAATVLPQTRIHYQSTQSELESLQGSIPQAVAAYEQLAADAGLNTAQISQLQTVDNTPEGGHCAFDGQGFVSGVQTMLTSYSNVMQGGNGVVQGLGAPSTGTVTKGVVGNENLQFVAARKREVERDAMIQMRWAQDVVEEPDFDVLICDRASCE